MLNRDSELHVRGESLFVDDLPEPAGLLHGAVFASPVAHARLVSLDTSAARAAEGVHAVFTAADLPGENQIGAIVPDEPLLAEGLVDFVGQPIALVVAETPEGARRAAQLVAAEFRELEPILDPRQAAELGQLIVPSRTLVLGDVDAAWPDCARIVEGRVESGGQEHLYLETQAALAVPLEGSRLRILAGTQGPTAVQRVAARVLALPMSSIEVEVQRLGGGFGGKEDQATPWAVLAALAAHRLGRPAKLVLSREEDLVLTGKRHPYSSDYKLGVDAGGRILAYQVTFYQNAGAAADLSPAILERSLFHATNSYAVPNARITGHSCRTNLPPFTAFRGFGGPQAIFVIECALAHAAEALGRDPAELQELNLLSSGDPFPYGMPAELSHARRAFAELTARHELPAARARVEEFNRTHPLHRRGLAVTPICFGISFTNRSMNQAGALVHVYGDGSVHVSTGAVEMGQGVATKLRAIAARTLGVGPERVSVASTSTTTVANTSPTAASAGADLNGRACELACAALRERLLGQAARALGGAAAEYSIDGEKVRRAGAEASLGWPELVQGALLARVNLSAQAHYATPGLDYDRGAERGRPFAYHVFGAALTEATVDCLRGTYTIDAVRIVHDAGRSLDPLVDRGQVEGGLLQGIGWLTVEELLFSDTGRLVTDSMAAYKIPDLYCAPGEVEVAFLEDADNPEAVLQSKGIGEPPLLYGIGAYLALRDAARAFRPDRAWSFEAPLTPERMLMFLHQDD